MLCSCQHHAEPKFDQNIGFTEDELRRTFGEPYSVTVYKSQDMVGELYGIARARVGDKDNVEIRTLLYGRGEATSYYWLAKSEDGQWRVIADATVPPGVQF